MKVSFTTMAVPGRGARAAAELARRYGYEGIDLRISDDLGEVRIGASAHELSKIRDVLSSCGILLSGLLCYNVRGGTEEASWQAMEESLLCHLELASQLGSPTIRIFAGDPRPYPDTEDFLKRCAETIAGTIGHDHSSVSLLLQNHLNGINTDQSVRLIERVGSPRLGLAFSPDHCILQQEDPKELQDAIRKHSRQLYLADLKMEGEGYACVLPGLGSVDLKAALRTVGGDGFGGWVTFKWEKIWNKELAEAEVALPFFMEYLHQMK